MTPDDIVLVQQSWRRVQPVKEVAADLFYLKLFELDPTLRARFAADMNQQGARLLQIISAAVRGLDRMDVLLPVMRNLGGQHALRGIRDDQYGAVATALLWTLDTTLNGEFTPQMKCAWIKIYGVLSQTLREASGAQAA